MQQESKRLLVDFTAIFVGLIGYLIARVTCVRYFSRGCEDNPGLQAVFLVGLSLIVISILIMVYERVVWKDPKLDLDGENTEEEQSNRSITQIGRWPPSLQNQS